MSPADDHPFSGTDKQGLVLLGQQGHIVTMDQGAERIFGRPALGWAGKPFESLLRLPPSPGIHWTDGAWQAHEAAGPPRTLPSPPGCEARRADGSSFPVTYLITGVAQKGSCFAVFVQDLSGKLSPVREDANAERQLHTLVELAPIAIWVTTGHQVSRANRAACALLGYHSASELIGKPVLELLNDDDRDAFRHQIGMAIQNEGQVTTLQARIRRHHAEPCEVEIAMAAVPDHGETTVQMVLSNVSQRNRELRELQRSRQLSKRLSANVVEAREEERRRIARELHDELGQRLSAVKMDIAHCAQSQGLTTASAPVVAVLVSLDAIIESVRCIASRLRPPMLDDLGLNDALDALVNDFSQRSGIQARLNIVGVDSRLNENTTIALYRMVQEALTNVARHARATQVRIDLRQEAAEITLSVRDNGVGLPQPSTPHRDGQFGLLGIQERADALGGQLLVDNLPEGGVSLVVHLPTLAHGPTRKARAASTPQAAG